MLLRELQEQKEREALFPFAMHSALSKGRSRKEEECGIRTVYQRDRDRILHSVFFRRLKGKTQVFLFPVAEGLRTRLTHTLEVTQIARTLARLLKLNEDLTEAVALGHDLGHPPFGHCGEEALAEVSPYGFQHAEQSVRVTEVLDKNGKGLNLTVEVRDGILLHTKGKDGDPLRLSSDILEYILVRISDIIAYVNHDIEDALSAGVLKPEELPSGAIKVLGDRHSLRVNTLITDILENSYGRPEINMSPVVYGALTELKDFLYYNVYVKEEIQKEFRKAKKAVQELYHYYTANPGAVRKALWFLKDTENIERLAVDHIASMSDAMALREYERIFLPSPWEND